GPHHRRRLFSGRSQCRAGRRQICLFLLWPYWLRARRSTVASSPATGVGPVMDEMKQILSGTAAFQHPILARSLAQLATSFGGFLVTCAVMYLCLEISL